jgi:exonuclease SbcD
MRFIHTSDWHLGRSLHGVVLLKAQAAFLDWLLTEAITRKVDAVVVAGDVYDRAVPSLDAVRLLDCTLAAFARARVAVVLTSGNHDSAIRLGFGGALNEQAGVHLRTSVADLARPVLVDGVGIYGIPYLLPDAVMDQLAVSVRSHEAVLTAAMDRIRADAHARGLDRVVIAAHAFVTGAAASESERDIRIGGIGDTPVSVFDGVSYVALGHLHGPQRVSPAGSATTVRYGGSPLAFSFSERHHTKSVAVVDIDSDCQVSVELVATPVVRRLVEVRGELADLLGADHDPDLAEAWVKAVLTDPVRPPAPMERLRAVWPHTLVLEFAPSRELIDPAVDVIRLAESSDPVDICGLFVEFVEGAQPSEPQRAVLREVVEAAQSEQVSA